jgi:hypothetical protein
MTRSSLHATASDEDGEGLKGIGEHVPLAPAIGRCGAFRAEDDASWSGEGQVEGDALKHISHVDGGISGRAVCNGHHNVSHVSHRPSNLPSTPSGEYGNKGRAWHGKLKTMRALRSRFVGRRGGVGEEIGSGDGDYDRESRRLRRKIVFLSSCLWSCGPRVMKRSAVKKSSAYKRNSEEALYFSNSFSHSASECCESQREQQKCSRKGGWGGREAVY